MIMKATMVVAGLDGDGRVRGGRGAVFRAVPLTHEVVDTQDGGVEDQVTSAAFGSPVSAARVGSQRLAEFVVEAIQRRTQVRREGDEVARALLDTTLRIRDLTSTWNERGEETNSSASKNVRLFFREIKS